MVFSILYVMTPLVAVIYALLGDPPRSYFSSKHNIFNQYFVKIGWFWVTLAYFAYLWIVPFQRSPPARKRQVLTSGLLRYVFVTAYWYAMTQWLLGPSLIDRVFVWTGGRCMSLLQDVEHAAKLNAVSHPHVCRNLGGRWTGGHDVSGHCVLLIHASLFLWEELSWLFYDARPFLQWKRQTENRASYFVVLGNLALLALWWWMLLMTGVYFHGRMEIVSGILFGILGWVILYLGLFPRVSFFGLLRPATRTTMVA
ncbi:Fat storage-inducing transmembrane protein [Mycotypha africana]|uniref:Fat storage-inducing transmembrane protein n=1 Tax=Mycotypha africana TaxID=64632 RepID=UPI0023011408|nr:Fat storage-inducing transmembrane protein [Mycotypha africana]KAI8967305.1 Fat storage-inducing transmembrane protein [Mycotypha africana]